MSSFATVCTIAGSDPTSGAGIQADLKTFAALGVHGTSVITSLTAQNLKNFLSFQEVPVENIRAQFEAITKGHPIMAIKIGMMGTLGIVSSVYELLSEYKGPVVLDPLLRSSSDSPLYQGPLVSYTEGLKTLFPLATVLTPNIPEAEQLLNRSLNSYTDIEKAAQDLLKLGVQNVVIKGGHFEDNLFSQDYWTNGSDSFWISTDRKTGDSYRGTGCTFSSALSVGLALGYSVPDALVIAKMFIAQGMRASPENSRYLAYPGWPENPADLPRIHPAPLYDYPSSFRSCASSDLGLYPVVDSFEWVKKLLLLGIKTIQLRIKDKQQPDLEEEILKSIEYANQFQAKLFINDHWAIALRLGAYGVHLGQEDLEEADLVAICEGGLRLGISTHCYREVARAHAFHPSYMACGPIFPTTSKQMPFAAQGLENLRRWCRSLPYPLVAIGGISADNLQDVIETGVSGFALISAITQAADPSASTEHLLRICHDTLIRRNGPICASNPIV